MRSYSRNWMILAALTAGCTADPAEKSATIGTPDKSSVEFEREREVALENLRDPESARFGPMYRGKGAAVCGTLNAHNAYGGYTGMQPFAVDLSHKNPGDRFYIYAPVGDYGERGSYAEILDERGCKLNGDAAQALNVRRLLNKERPPVVE